MNTVTVKGPEEPRKTTTGDIYQQNGTLNACVLCHVACSKDHYPVWSWSLIRIADGVQISFNKEVEEAVKNHKYLGHSAKITIEFPNS